MTQLYPYIFNTFVARMPVVTNREIHILSLQQQILYLLPEKVIYIPALGSLFIADPHFGKAAHFRKAGIPIPEYLHDLDLEKIQNLICDFEPTDIFFLGDLFHSEINGSWFGLEEFINQFTEINFHLVKGNHDVLPASTYLSTKWIIHKEPVIISGLILSHEPLAEVPEGKINLCGHIHPGILLRGVGRQHLVLPCFFVSHRQIILPAFGRFTGLATMSRTQTDQVFVITDKKVIPII